jgi:hypothetical protein
MMDEKTDTPPATTPLPLLSPLHVFAVILSGAKDPEGLHHPSRSDLSSHGLNYSCRVPDPSRTGYWPLPILLFFPLPLSVLLFVIPQRSGGICC